MGTGRSQTWHIPSDRHLILREDASNEKQGMNDTIIRLAIRKRSY